MTVEYEGKKHEWTALAKPIVDILADAHDPEDDATCLFDNGDGSCLSCRLFEAFGEYDVKVAEVIERLNAIERWEYREDESPHNFKTNIGEFADELLAVLRPMEEKK